MGSHNSSQKNSFYANKVLEEQQLFLVDQNWLSTLVKNQAQQEQQQQQQSGDRHFTSKADDAATSSESRSNNAGVAIAYDYGLSSESDPHRKANVDESSERQTESSPIQNDIGDSVNNDEGI